jgi:hypothetical protein
MSKRILMLLLPATLSLATSCAFIPKPVALAPVGPGPYGHATTAPTGFLEVYTAVKCYPYDRQFYYAHTAYGVYDTGGRHVRSVDNESYFHSLEPEVVSLPPGSYSVVGWADGYELVKVPVIIKAGLLTQVNLETHGEAAFPGARTNDMVRMEDGRIVGWPAGVTTSP